MSNWAQLGRLCPHVPLAGLVDMGKRCMSLEVGRCCWLSARSSWLELGNSMSCALLHGPSTWLRLLPVGGGPKKEHSRCKHHQPLLTSHLLMSHLPEPINCPSPKSTRGDTVLVGRNRKCGSVGATKVVVYHTSM